MKNKIILLILVFFFNPLLADTLNIKSSTISIDKKTKLTLFKNNVVARDEENNILETEYAEYNKETNVLITKDKTNITTSENFYLSGENIIFDNKNNLIRSNSPATIKDLEDNKIYLEKFEYSTINKFFKSTGNIKVVDSKNNSYNFSQIFIDEKKREIIGTDIKAYINQNDFKSHVDNKPRIFANTIKIDDKKNQFTKSVFTMCDYRKGKKCPPWSLQATQMTHDRNKKTIFYDDAIVKIYDIPVFYFPKLAHPDPTVKRRSGFLPPSFSDSKNLGIGTDLPYFWAINNDKDLTISNKLFASEHPLFIGEYRQAFKNSNLIVDSGYTAGYKNTSKTKKSGNKSHFFSKYIKNFKGKQNSDNSLIVSIQDVSDDKYLKLYKIKSDLVDYETDTLTNSLNFTHQEDDLFLGFEVSSHETLKDSYNDKYEYILPDILLDKNLYSDNKFGNIDFQSNLKVHNYDTNKVKRFLINDFDWKMSKYNFSSGIQGSLLGKLKNVNYETNNIDIYKSEPTSEMFGALGWLSEIDLYKKTANSSNHLFSPKILFRYAPGNMRKEDDNARLNHLNVFSLDRLNINDNFETGISTTLGFDYEIKKPTSDFNFTIGQVINDNSNNKMPDSSSLDNRFSDVVGNSSYKINNSDIELNYSFALDQNYKQLNYNEVGAKIDLNPIKFDFNYLQEKEHIGNNEYVTGKIDLTKGRNGFFSAETKRNLITNSAEYYSLSYEYLNDCLRAGLVYRREFYNDSELEPENSLMFKISLTPFGNINSPSFR